MNILIADDDRVARMVLECTLVEWGHQVVAVPDGLAALRVLSGPDAPRLAILDWEMPGLEGPEVCRQIRSRAIVPPPYLVLLSAREGPEVAAAVTEVGANEFISKPFDFDDLKFRIDAGTREFFQEGPNESQPTRSPR